VKRFRTRHPRLLAFLVFASSAACTYLVAQQKSASGTPEHPQATVFCICCLIFGLLCIRFPQILGEMQGPAGRGAWLNPTPGSLVSVMGWIFLAAPQVVWLILV